MKKSIIAIAVAAATLSATSVSAATVYEEGANKVTIGGRLAVKAVHTESVGTTDSSTEMENASSRITFGFEHEMTLAGLPVQKLSGATMHLLQAIRNSATVWVISTSKTTQ